MTTTEFGKLKKVVVGDAKNAKIPSYDISFHTVCHADKPLRWRSQSQSYPKQVIEEAQEDLEKVVDALKGFGVEVLRKKRRKGRFNVPYIMVGNAPYFKDKDILKWLEKQSREG